MNREHSVDDLGLRARDARRGGRGDRRGGVAHLGPRLCPSDAGRIASRTPRLVTLTIAGAAVLAALAARPLLDGARAQWRAVGADSTSIVASAGARESSTCAEHVQVRLFFGLVTPTGTVSDAEWANFLADIITPRVPRGLTVVHADGQWRAPGHTAVRREPSQVVEIVDHGGPDMDRRIHEVVEIYRRRFRQDSVLLTRGRVEACY